MFGIPKKDPKKAAAKKLRQKYEACMRAAVDLQRSGDVRGFAEKSEKAAQLEKQLDALESVKD